MAGRCVPFIMRIFIADDNEFVRRGVIGLLAPRTNWQICGEARDGAEAIQKARELLPDLILLDISMPGLDGLEVARRLRQEVCTSKILIMSQHDATRMLPRAVEAGANACVDKSRLSEDLLLAIDRIADARDAQ